MKKIIIIALLYAFFVTPALADNTGKMYIGGDLGASTFSNIEPFPNPGVIRFVFGTHLSPNLAAEVGYSIFGDSTYSGPGGSATLSARAFQIVAIGSLPLNPQFDLTGKVGLTHNSGKLTSTFGVSDEQTNNGLMLGIGAQFHINSQTTLRLQYEDYGDFDNYSPAISATAVSFGVLFGF